MGLMPPHLICRRSTSYGHSVNRMAPSMTSALLSTGRATERLIASPRTPATSAMMLPFLPLLEPTLSFQQSTRTTLLNARPVHCPAQHSRPSLVSWSTATATIQPLRASARNKFQTIGMTWHPIYLQLLTLAHRYKRPTLFTAVDFTLKMENFFAYDPSLISIGGNTNGVNTFTGLDVGNLTRGVINGANLLEGRNLWCLGESHTPRTVVFISNPSKTTPS